MPFWASGKTSEKAKAAALPELVSSQMPVRSKNRERTLLALRPDAGLVEV